MNETAHATILVVDDQPEMAMLVARYLTAEGYLAIVALSGAEARERLAERPDIVLLDVLMHDANGFDLCREFKADPQTALVPVVLVTSLDGKEDRIRGIEAGCDEFLSKPVNRDELRARIRSLLKLQETRRGLESARMAREAEHRASLRHTFERYVAPGVVDQILSKGGDPFAADAVSRMEAVALFADMRGFTRMSEKLAAPEVVRILNEYFSTLTQAAHRHGGTILGMAGDSLLVGFGVPLAMADMERAALLAARDMLLQAEPLVRVWKEQFGVSLGVGVGINRGEVVAANVGSPTYINYTIIGDTVNIAARLTALAPAGQMLCAERLDESAEGLGDKLRKAQSQESTLKGRVLPVRATAWLPVADPPPPRVLVIDDQAEFRALARKFIEVEWPGAVVAEYDPVINGLPPRGFHWHAHDVVLLDYMMGPYDGLIWLRELRAREGIPPIIFMTASGTESIAAAAMKLGAAEYLSKNDTSRRKLAAAIVEALRGAAPRAAAPPAATPAAPAASAFAVRAAQGAPAAAIGVDDYEMIRKLGEGGMAVVHLARHRATGQERVLKILDTRASTDADFLDRFIREYGVVSRIASPHVVRIFDQGMTENHAYIAMELLSGGDLKQRMDGPLPPEEAMRIFRELLVALTAVHAQGIVHRDLKPHNMMFRADGSLALVDFGIAKELAGDQQLTQLGTVIGTPLYMSPEQGAGEAVDYRTDLYSAGAVLYEMLTGKPPFTAPSIVGLLHKHRNAPVPKLPANLVHYQVIIDRLMAKRREDRYQSARELLPESY